jgi:hypothetical protein
MTRVKIAKFILYFAAVLFVAKPFVGFDLFGHFNSPVQTNIFVKVFSKRKMESKHSDYAAIQKKLSEPLTDFFLRFSFFLSILFPFLFNPVRDLTVRFLRGIYLSLLPRQLTLLTGQLLI